MTVKTLWGKTSAIRKKSADINNTKVRSNQIKSSTKLKSKLKPQFKQNFRFHFSSFVLATSVPQSLLPCGRTAPPLVGVVAMGVLASRSAVIAAHIGVQQVVL